MDFDLRQLEVFCKVIELRSFTRAAKAVHLSQASVSERVATLEKIIGAKLLDRLGRKILPTQTGKLLYKHASELLAMKKDIVLNLEDFLGIRKGTVTIGGSTIPGEYILPAIIKPFRSKYPEVIIHLGIADSEEIISKVSEGLYEIGFVGLKEKTKSLAYEKIWEDELVLVAPYSHRWSNKSSVSLAEIRKEPFICRENGSGTRRILEKRLIATLGATDSNLNVTAVMGSTTAVKEAIKEALGVSILSSKAIITEVNSKILKVLKISDFPIKRTFFLVYDTRRIMSPLCRAFKDFILSTVET